MFFEVGIQSKSFGRAGFTARDELEDPLEDRLRELGLGEVTGGGSGAGRLNIDVEVAPHIEAETGATILLNLLKELGAPVDTVVRANNPERGSWSLKTLRSNVGAKREHLAGSVSRVTMQTRSRVSIEVWAIYRRLVLRDASFPATKSHEKRGDEIVADAHGICVPVNATEQVGIVLWRGGRSLARPPQFDGMLRLKTGFLVLSSMVFEEFHCMPIGRGTVRARVWTDAVIEPEKVWVQLSDE